MTEGELTTWRYTPKNGLLHFNAWNHVIEGSSVSTAIPDTFMTTRTGPESVNWTASGSAGKTGSHNPKGDPIAGVGIAGMAVVSSRYVPTVVTRQTLTEIPIEDRMNPGSFQGKIPSLTIGIEPEYSLVNETAPPELVQCHVDLVVTTYCTVSYTTGVRYRYKYGGNLYVPDNRHAPYRLNMQYNNEMQHLTENQNCTGISPNMRQHMVLQSGNKPPAQVYALSSNPATVEDKSTFVDIGKANKEVEKAIKESNKHQSSNKRHETRAHLLGRDFVA
jgi:hypothetical protein